MEALSELPNKLTIFLVRCLAASDLVIAFDGQGAVQSRGPYSAMSSDAKASLESIRRSDVDEDQPSKTTQPSSCAPRGPPSPKNEDFARKTGDVTLYMYYIRSFGRRYALLFLVSYTGFAFTKNFPQILLEWWTRNESAVSIYAPVYALLAAMTVIFSAGSMYITFLRIMPTSAVALHETLLRSVLRAPQALFDSTDTGVILNMFSQDMALITMPLTVSLHMAGQSESIPFPLLSISREQAAAKVVECRFVQLPGTSSTDWHGIRIHVFIHPTCPGRGLRDTEDLSANLSPASTSRSGGPLPTVYPFHGDD